MKNEDREAIFPECVREIDTEYKRLSHTLGWRFLYGSRSVLDGPADIALVTINPAGAAAPKDHPWDSCESGVAYLTERWDNAEPGQSTLQLQVQGLFHALSAEPSFQGPAETLLARSVLSHLIPFRSPKFATLPRQQESIAFGRSLWRKLLPRITPRLIVCLGRDVQDEFRALIPLALEASRSGSVSHPTGWGK